ncbi:MAG: hypothetical protein JWN17_1464 [Frankiales bacterium]|nr:hypothetical protein [Frankiales bacterium]
MTTTTAEHPGLVQPHTSAISEDLVEVRAWARSVGFPVDESAGVPLEVLRTYRQVHARAH